MIPVGIELFQLRERQTPNGDCYFTTQVGNALVIMVRDPIERDLWRAIATDPNRASNRNGGSTACAIAAPTVDSDGCYQDDSISDDLPEDLMASPSQLGGR